MNISPIDLAGVTLNATVDHPEVCPVCHHAVEPRLVVAANIARDVDPIIRLEVVYRCPRQKCQRLFIAPYLQARAINQFHNPKMWKSEKCVPFEHQDRTFDEKIGKLSERFAKIYNQASTAETGDFDELCGPGYRKALEFLVKDYVKTLRENKGAESAIEASSLGQCISNFVKDASIKACAKRATWLGNDETHYVRKWPEKDLTDLKNLIELTIHWISSEILTRELETSMPAPGEAAQRPSDA